MRYFGRAYRDRWALFGAVVVPPAVAAVLLPWRSSLANTDVALLLVVVIVAVAANGHRLAGVLTALSAAVWFDFFWTQPYERFTITHGADVRTTVLLLAVGAAVSELAFRGRRARRTVAFDTAYLRELRSVSDLVAEGGDPLAVAEHVRGLLVALLGLREARFERGQLLGHPPQLAEDGNLRWGGAVWKVEEYGLPAEDIELRARSAGTTAGRYMLTPTPGTVPSLQARQVASMLAAYVGVAFTRQHSRLAV